jgi:hypothetical protein
MKTQSRRENITEDISQMNWRIALMSCLFHLPSTSIISKEDKAEERRVGSHLVEESKMIVVLQQQNK